MSGICSAHQGHDPNCPQCNALPWNMRTCGCVITGDPRSRTVKLTFENDEGYESMMRMLEQSEDVYPCSENQERLNDGA